MKLPAFAKRLVDLFGSGPEARRMTSGVMANRTEPPVRGTREFLEAYEGAPWVRACAAKTGDALGCTQWALGRVDRPDEEITDHLMLRVLRNPNPIHTGHDLIKLAQISVDLVGDAFWLKDRNVLGAPVGLYPIPAHWIQDIPNPARPTFKVSWNAWQGELPASELMWFSDPAPATPYSRGNGSVRALADEIETAEYASKHAKQLFFNRAMPDVVIMDVGAGDSEIKIHERSWNNRLQGFWRAFKPYFTNRELKFWQPTAMNLENLTMVPLLKHERDTIVQVWGIPPEQFGITESSNRATADASDYIFEGRVVQPRRERFAAQLTTRLAPDYDERLVVRFKSTVPRDKEHDLAVMGKNPGAFRVDEWRAAAGEKALGGPAGKAHIVPLNSFATSDLLDQEQRPKGAPPKDEPKEEEKPKPKEGKQ